MYDVKVNGEVMNDTPLSHRDATDLANEWLDNGYNNVEIVKAMGC